MVFTSRGLLVFVALSIILVTFDSAEARAHKKRSAISCSSSTKYIRGYQETSPKGEAECEARPRPYWDQTTQCNWQAIELKSYTHWNQCPTGFFLQASTDEEMKCCKPSNHPRSNSVCSTVETKESGGQVLCPDGHFITETEDKKCSGYACTSSVKCCKMFDPVPSFKSFDDVKRRSTDDTSMPLSYLAHMLGFGWCGGCRGRKVGENFKLTATGWEGDREGDCQGYRSYHRLHITYSDWRQRMSNVRYGLNKVRGAETVSTTISGRLENDQTSTVKFTIGKEIERKHIITHSKLSSYTMSHETGFEISYRQNILAGEFEATTSYKFGYENTQEEVNEKGNEETNKLIYSVNIPVKPCTTVDYEIRIYSLREEEEYEADIQTEFSVKLDGFLRYGGGANWTSTNYHNKYRGRGNRPTVSHKFGAVGLPFYEDLQRQVDEDHDPWQWQNMKSRYGSVANTVIDFLKNSRTHMLTLRGKIEEEARIRADAFFTVGEPPAGCVLPNDTGSDDDKKRRKREVVEEKKTWMKTLDMTTGKWSDDQVLPDVQPNGNVFASAANITKIQKVDKTTTVYSFTDQESNISEDFDISFVALDDFFALSVGTSFQEGSGLALIMAGVVTAYQMKQSI